jgi:hypothetical protein
MIRRQLEVWKAEKKYTSAEEKEEQGIELLDAVQAGQIPQWLDRKQKEKLQRHYKGKKDKSDMDKKIVDVLNNLQVAESGSSSDAAPDSKKQDAHPDSELGPVAYASSTDDVSFASSNNRITDELVGQAADDFFAYMYNTADLSTASSDTDSSTVTKTTSESPNTVDHVADENQWAFSGLGQPFTAHMPGSEETAALDPGPQSWSQGGHEGAFGNHQAVNVANNYANPPSTSGPLIRQPAQFNFNMQMLFHLSQGYYLSKLYEQQLQVQAIDHGAVYGSSDCRSSLGNNRHFWDKVKNGLYWLNMSSGYLAWPELREAYGMVPLLCESEPVALLKDIYATLSPVATTVYPAVREMFLCAFRDSVAKKLPNGHMLPLIFRILCDEGGSDDLSATALKAMLDATRSALPAEHPDLFDLQRTLVRLQRRKAEFVDRMFSEAESLGWSLIESSKRMWGRPHARSRLAVSEFVYILNAQGRYEESLKLAEGVLLDARREVGREDPDACFIYAMEDVAEIYDKLGRIDDCIDMLSTASREALTVWGDHGSTRHIMDNLREMNQKRHRQSLQRQVST